MRFSHGSTWNERGLRSAALAGVVGVLAAGATPGVLHAGASPTATYQVTFDATWSAQTHPQNFPPGPHFSGLIGGTHDSTVAFWQVGQLASPGIEAMAETGAKSPLDSEVQAAILAGSAGSVLSGGGIGPSPGSVTMTFTLEQAFPLVTLVSMIAPSPDWFVGVSGLALFENGVWAAQKTVALFPFDAGTDSGSNYTSPNQDTQPPQPIAAIQTPPAGNGVPFGTFTFTRVDGPAAVPASTPWGRVTLALFALGLGVAGLRRRARATGLRSPRGIV